MTRRGWLSLFRAGEQDKAPPANRHLALLAEMGIRPAPPPLVKTKAALLQSAAPRARLVFALDATGSRQVTWETCAVPLTDALLTALPGHQLDVALAWYGGGRVTFTGFTSHLGTLRDRAAGVRPKAGRTQFLEILTRCVLQTEGVKVVCLVADTFEESPPLALKLADALKARGTRLLILHDSASQTFGGAEIFAQMAERTGGAVLPFDASALPRMKDLVGAIGVLAVGGTPMLEARQETMPAAKLLLSHLGRGKIR